MVEDSYTKIGYHLSAGVRAGADTAIPPDASGHLDWAFVHALREMADPEALWLPDGRPEVHAIIDETLCFIRGGVQVNDENANQPFASVDMDSWPLDEEWALDWSSVYGQVKHGQGFTTQWVFRRAGEEVLLIEGVRRIDPYGKTFGVDEAEEFARLLAAKLGCPAPVTQA